MGNEHQLGLFVAGKGLKLRKIPGANLWVCGFGFGRGFKGLEKCGKMYREVEDENGRSVIIESQDIPHKHPSTVIMYPSDLENENPPNLPDEAVLPSQPIHSSSQSSSTPQNSPIDQTAQLPKPGSSQSPPQQPNYPTSGQQTPRHSASQSSSSPVQTSHSVPQNRPIDPIFLFPNPGHSQLPPQQPNYPISGHQTFNHLTQMSNNPSQIYSSTMPPQSYQSNYSRQSFIYPSSSYSIPTPSQILQPPYQDGVPGQSFQSASNAIPQSSALVQGHFDSFSKFLRNHFDLFHPAASGRVKQALGTLNNVLNSAMAMDSTDNAYKESRRRKNLKRAEQRAKTRDFRMKNPNYVKRPTVDLSLVYSKDLGSLTKPQIKRQRKKANLKRKLDEYWKLKNENSEKLRGLDNTEQFPKETESDFPV